VERETDIHLTVLTLLILALIGTLMVYTGIQAVSTERSFFRDLTFSSNLAVAKMVAREVTQVFTNGVGLVEDLARFPSFRDKNVQAAQDLFDLELGRHGILRTLYLKDPSGATLMQRYRSGKEFKPLPDDQFKRLLKPGGNYFMSEPYFLPNPRAGTTPLALTYAVAIEGRKIGEITGVVGAELDLECLPDILAAVQVGHTGQLLIVGQGKSEKPEVIFSSRNMKEPDVNDFLTNFPFGRALTEERAGFEYEGQIPKMASYATLHGVAIEPGDRYFGGRSPFPVPVTPSRLPNWMVVVQQHAAEGYIVAERMKYNIIVLVMVGLFGVLVIAKLWMDSLTD
jgi:hypothetical protein